MFIDGVSLHASARALGFDIDYKRLLEQFRGHGRLVRAYYYAGTEDQDYFPARALTDWLTYNGYSVASGRKTKSNLDIELTVNAMELAGQLDEMVLFSGDSAFRRLVEAVQRRGVRVTVVSTVASRLMTVSNDLRRQADAFIDLADLRPAISRGIAHSQGQPPSAAAGLRRGN